MDKVPSTAPIPGQVFGEVNFMHVTFKLFLPRSPRSSSTSLALYYNAFDPSFLHMPKPSQPILPHLAVRGAIPNFSLSSWFIILLIIVLPRIHLSIRISITSILCSKTFFTDQHSVPYNNAGLIATR